MKIIGKLLKLAGKIVLTLLAFLLVCILLYFGKLKFEELQAHREIKEVQVEMKPLSAEYIPENISILSIGEAAHGCKEMQELKLSVFKEMVEKRGFTAFALEADYGECAEINRYVQGGEGSAEEMVQKFAFPIYHTKEMAELISWMREWNASAPEDKKVRFYGFDMQDPEGSYAFLKEYSLSHKLTSEEEFSKNLDCIKDENFSLNEKNAGEVITFLDSLKEKVEKSPEEAEKEKRNAANEQEATDKQAFKENQDFLMELNTVRQAAETWLSKENSSVLRDRDMEENVKKILEMEQKIGSGKLVISAHDGHIQKENPIYNSMGVLLTKDFGEAYYAIGTDVWKVTDNIKVLGEAKRTVQSFVSVDPLAAQARFAKGKQYALYFSSITDEKSKVYQLIHTPMEMLQLGEGYSFLLRFFPNRSYRVKSAPVQRYDSMIYLYEGNPIEILEKK
ncbi:MAG: erythromycin esterase family protein [Oribacterium sinus]|uniref:Erythromycin esterase family protein n=1 Tax=Oribacterium sinus TaxID=237576 RepID=A0A930DV02_9FIRM|nr:erythromycin esterase family protein [Oribacterium sinus]